MIHPSYQELIQAINEGQESEDEPLVTSRYSIVLATSKRARQLIAGAQPMVKFKIRKALYIAVEELYKGKVKILPEEETGEEEKTEE